jgi:hypothetical protein
MNNFALGIVLVFAIWNGIKAIIIKRSTKSSNRSRSLEINLDQYSDYNCIGYSTSTRSCIFYNICFNAARRTWTFYYNESLSTSLKHFLEILTQCYFGHIPEPKAKVIYKFNERTNSNISREPARF